MISSHAPRVTTRRVLAVLFPALAAIRIIRLSVVMEISSFGGMVDLGLLPLETTVNSSALLSLRQDTHSHDDLLLPADPSPSDDSYKHINNGTDLQLFPPPTEESLALAIDHSIVVPTFQAQAQPWPEASMLSIFASKVDRVYICCVRCSEIQWIHPTWAPSVSLVDGKLFDKWDPHEPKDASKLGNVRKTRMHRAVIAHAKLRHGGAATTTMILEEDVKVSPMANNGTVTWAEQVLSIDGWSLIRMDHLWYQARKSSKRKRAKKGSKRKKDGCPSACKCVQARAGAVPVEGACVLTPEEKLFSKLPKDGSWYKEILKHQSGFCDLRSTSAYIVSSRAYDHFLHHGAKPWNKVIDLAPVNTVPVQVILHPMPALQLEKMSGQLKTSAEFESKCVVRFNSSGRVE